MAAAGLALASVALLVRALLRTPSDELGAGLTHAAKVAGLASALTGLAGLVIALRRTPPREPARLELTAPRLLVEDYLFDRVPEMQALTALIGRADVVNCHGQRGAGKSFLLEHLSDVVNGHRGPARDHPRPTGMEGALYFDLADAGGFGEIEAQVGSAAFGLPTSRWPDFIAYVDRTFGRRHVLLILDNVNAPGLWPSLGRATYQYLASRPTDRIVLGSIEPVRLANLRVEYVVLEGMAVEPFVELALSLGVDLRREDAVELHELCGGLPLYVRLLTAYRHELFSGGRTGLLEASVDVQLVPKLGTDTRKVLAFVALLALVKREVSVAELRRCPVANVESSIDDAARLSLLTRPAHDDRRLLRIHDVFRDALLRVLKTEVAGAAAFLVRDATRQRLDDHAALFAMYADPAVVGEDRLDDLLTTVIARAVRSRNYALLASLHAYAEQNDRILQFRAANEERSNLFSYARASELAGLGLYGDAEDELLSSGMVGTRWQPQDAAPPLYAEMRYLHADIAHLLNRYDQAAQMFSELADWSTRNERPLLHARCLWGHAHVLRHQGRDLDRSLALFERVEELAERLGELQLKAYAITSATAIRVFIGDVPDDEEQRLEAIEAEVAAASTHDGYLLKVWKAQAQVRWHLGHHELALCTMQDSVEAALHLNDRSLYNHYFERAEYLRLTGSAADAVADYRLVLGFGEGNGDSNLVANALLGLVLADLSAGEWRHYSSLTAARAATLNARSLAVGADIRATTQAAEQVIRMVEDADRVPPTLRLILF
jgi:tetratricopeptide (TPR) repeat protein